MKKVIFILCIIMLASINLVAYEIPKFTNYVNDYGNLLSEQEKTQLNIFLKKYEDSTSNQIAVLTLLKYDDRAEGSLFDYSYAVFKLWKIGQSNKNNGVLLVVVKNLASKNAPGLRITTGYGLEGALPDAICRRIIENIRPLINEGKYYQGINLGLTSMVSQIKGEFSADQKKNNKDASEMAWIIIFIVIGIIIVIVIVVSTSSYGGGGSSYAFFSSGDSGGSSFSGGFDGGGGGSCGGGGAGD